LQNNWKKKILWLPKMEKFFHCFFEKLIEFFEKTTKAICPRNRQGDGRIQFRAFFQLSHFLIQLVIEIFRKISEFFEIFWKFFGNFLKFFTIFRNFLEFFVMVF